MISEATLHELARRGIEVRPDGPRYVRLTHWRRMRNTSVSILADEIEPFDRWLENIVRTLEDHARYDALCLESSLR